MLNILRGECKICSALKAYVPLFKCGGAGISDVCSLEERDFYAAIKSIECG